ncbi:MAG: iron-containing alcohol dehydrogenase [Gammaproteobacteria bacterium]|nr:iron-containing alcohol dehydrogenase [Gammaproteobacteria bacterium]
MTPRITPQNWNYPTTIRFGCGRINELGGICRELGMSAPLLVTDPQLATLPPVQDALAACLKADLRTALYHDIQSNPLEHHVAAGVAVLRAGNHDGVIALGGGSALDAGKAIALMAGQTRPLFDFEDRADWWTRVDEAGMVPVAAVPTTAGTGSEVGRAAVITDEQARIKKIIFHPRMLPERVILDPQVTLGMPPALTAAVGMDALSHALEAFCSPVFHPMAQGIAVEAMRLIHEHLESAFKDGDNIEARAHMQVAATMGATAFQKGLGAMHAMSHPCGAVLGTHHGLTNAVVMPYVLIFNRAAVAPQMDYLARTLGLSKPGFAGVLAWIMELREMLNIPTTLATLGVQVEHIEQLAPMAVADPSAATNPVELTLGDAKRLFKDAIKGRL